ncbi:DNA alkylation repair protein [Luteipulveratus sp. YIM 133132]|uniref:DNA alkylation repair protein n=1 Tax=Luteipulveratus flavus TaxID=3031728 RepID=UPI0023B1693E|nr:DNA alkylation repair protein [Luteipulveratus sp. YIM 133132]MDE9364242.1 DNA alkylation repair protein [Luteipulveratus sp. YIM 133132]
MVVRSTPLADELTERVCSAGSTTDAEAKARFFGAVPGGYAEGDVLVGVRVPVLRRVAGSVKRKATLDDIDALLASDIHEVRLLGGLLLVEAYRAADGERRDDVVHRLLQRLDRLDNWDLVDTVAPYTLGPWLLTQPDDAVLRLLDRLADSPVLWERRFAVVSTFALIRAGRPEPTLHLAKRLLGDEADLVRKAVGWMLREVGARDRALLDSFLDEHAPAMPKVMLRYALEKHAPSDRARFRNR